MKRTPNNPPRMRASILALTLLTGLTACDTAPREQQADEFRIYPPRPGCDQCGLTIEETGYGVFFFTLKGDFDAYTIESASIDIHDTSGNLHSFPLADALFEDTYFGKSQSSIVLAPVEIALSNKAIVPTSASLSLTFIDGVTTQDALTLLVE